MGDKQQREWNTVAIADKPNVFGITHSKEALMQIAEDYKAAGFWFDPQHDALRYRGDGYGSIDCISANTDATILDIY